jgi:hypothetical protein
MDDLKLVSERRSFLGGVAATARGGAGCVGARRGRTNAAAATGSSTDFSKWLDRIPGKYRQVADAPEPNGGMGLIYTFAFLVSAPWIWRAGIRRRRSSRASSQRDPDRIQRRGLGEV